MTSHALSLEEELAAIANRYSLTASKKDNYEIQLFPKLAISLDVSKYPKKPTIKVPKQFTDFIGDLEYFIPMLSGWKQTEPSSVSEIIDAYYRTMEMISGKKMYIKQNLLDSIIMFAKEKYPLEGVCVLRSLDGALSELVMNPGAISSPFSVIYNPRSVGYDRRLIATCHFHPMGSAKPSGADIGAFTKYPLNIIMNYPYSIRSLKIYNNYGVEINYSIL
jgi:proteasome lid subunit RPN8/RPN11